MLLASLLCSDVCATRKKWNTFMENTALPKAKSADCVSPVTDYSLSNRLAALLFKRWGGFKLVHPRVLRERQRDDQPQQ